MEELDYRGMDQAGQQRAIRAYEEGDRAKGFVFESAPLLRVGLLRLSDRHYRIVWTTHHLILDGWSKAILLEEFLKTYESLVEGEEIKQGEQDRYEDYIRYIERQDRGQEAEYWRGYLQGLESGSLLPFVTAGAEQRAGRVCGRGVVAEPGADAAGSAICTGASADGQYDHAGRMGIPVISVYGKPGRAVWGDGSGPSGGPAGDGAAGRAVHQYAAVAHKDRRDCDGE